MNLTEYAALNVKITEFSKVNNQFSLGRARVFYEGPNINRTIINSEVAKELIKTIPGTPIVGRFNSDNEDFEGHGEGQIAYGFVPLDPNPLKVEVTEDYYGLPVKRTYYEVDAVIWDERFPEAKKILGEEKSLSMELNPETLDGEFEIYDDKTYLKITNAEFYGITVLGDGHTPCFKDAKFLQAYTSMLGAYEALTKEQESNIGGKNMPNAEEKVVEVEVTETDSTITNEEAPVETEATEVVETEEVEVVAEDEAAEETPTEDGVEEGTEEETEAEEAAEDETGEFEEAEEVSEDETEESEEEEAEESSAESDEEPEVEEETEAESADNEETEALKAEVAELKSKLEVYETAAKEELVSKFSAKINDADFMNDIKEKLADYSVEDLKSVLGAKLAEQVLVEETTDEEKTNGLIYSFNGVAKKETEKGWQNLVRATKAANKKN